ncbi:MAG: hypothetical protein Q3M24_16565 [Candidatus Electrothrix aestuarii]|uniref:Tetratricopeptide repeat-containing protein n=1 Tax=Candidatus Electrothrix aestuarii TaxID=3062594 RepID=A0AAU8LSM2_9BACT|nr:hypothetical protein [Candidatus Electrothrix aestuarii]
MSSSTEFLLYVTVYRLSVLAIGALSIYLGFRLFHNAAGSRETPVDSAGTASAEGGSFKLTMTSILPGTYFALFGTVIIGIMLWEGQPEMLRKEVVETKAQNGSESKSLKEESYRDPKVNLDAVPVSALEQEWKTLGKSGAIQADAAVPFVNIARAWQEEGRVGEALAMARLAYLYGPELGKAGYRSLLVELMEAGGKAQDVESSCANLEKLRQKIGGEGE